MIKKLVFVWDFLYHDCNIECTYHYAYIDVLKTLIKLSTGMDIIELRVLKNYRGEQFSRQKFYELSNYYNIQDSYFSYDISKFKQESIEYLNSFIDSETFVFGIEIGLDLRNILTDLNIKFLNFWFHSWKLFDDALWMINTNDKQIFDKLNLHKVPKEKFLFYANYWKNYAVQNHNLDYLNFLEDNSCLFIGQTMVDKSTDRNGTMLNILHFKNEIEKLSKKYSKIYYVPHPLALHNEEIENYLKQTEYIEKLENINTYHLLMSEKISHIVGISSSVLYEAKFFNKEVEYLYKPLFKIDEEFSLETFVSIFNDYFNPHFWADILSVAMDTNKNVEDKIWFANTDNKLRNINHNYYNYKYFNETYISCENLKKEMSHLISIVNNKHKLRLKYLIYKILSGFTRGKIKKDSIWKKRLIKSQLEEIKNLK